MKYWYYFWTASFILAGSAFVLITLIVLVRGIADLREMLTRLGRRKITGESSPSDKSQVS